MTSLAGRLVHQIEQFDELTTRGQQACARAAALHAIESSSLDAVALLACRAPTSAIAAVALDIEALLANGTQHLCLPGAAFWLVAHGQPSPTALMYLLDTAASLHDGSESIWADAWWHEWLTTAIAKVAQEQPSTWEQVLDTGATWMTEGGALGATGARLLAQLARPEAAA
jgi:hypothetical protein